MDPSRTGRAGLLAGREALIAGAGPNIGRALAGEMGVEGARIVLTDVDEPTLRARKLELRDEGIRVRTFRSDITLEEDTEALFQTLDQRGVRIDTLVSNVGVDRPGGLLDDFSPTTWTDTFLANVVGPVQLAREVVRRVLEGGETHGEEGASRGSILFITSIHQWTPRGHAAYSASKAALGMVIQELALELAPHGIRVNGIAPGYVRHDEAGDALPHPRTPLGQLSVLPRYIGRAAVYLASDHFSCRTTGTVLTVDGGLSLVNHLSAGRSPANAGERE